MSSQCLRSERYANDISKWDWNECVGRVIAECAVDGTFRAWLIELLLSLCMCTAQQSRAQHSAHIDISFMPVDASAAAPLRFIRFRLYEDNTQRAIMADKVCVCVHL